MATMMVACFMDSLTNSLPSSNASISVFTWFWMTISRSRIWMGYSCRSLRYNSAVKKLFQ